MPAFSHFFLKRLRALSKDSPSFTRIPGKLGIHPLTVERIDRVREAARGCPPSPNVDFERSYPVASPYVNGRFGFHSNPPRRDGDRQARAILADTEQVRLESGTGKRAVQPAGVPNCRVAVTI